MNDATTGEVIESKRITVLGGGSPFTVALVDSLFDARSRLPSCELVLHGRDQRNLHAVTEYGRHSMARQGWAVNSTTNLEAAVAGADIVIHQVRYGGLAGRELDELAAVKCGCAADETLGPGALHAILRTRHAILEVADVLRRCCPKAWILNLTNPLSLVTALMMESGLTRCIGLCELPSTTAQLAAQTLGLGLAELSWQYVGLNHRGFLVGLQHEGVDQVDELARRLMTRTIGGVTAAEIKQLHALPTKYFPILSGRYRPRSGRAAFLAELRSAIGDELCRNPTVRPSNLNKRCVDWYPAAVVPMIAALLGSCPCRQIVNVLGNDGFIQERIAMVSSSSLCLTDDPPVSAGVAEWLAICQAHEVAMLACMRAPSLDAVKRALDLDPLVMDKQAGQIARILWDSYARVTQTHSN